MEMGKQGRGYMKESLKKSAWYGVAAFVLDACYFGVITLTDSHRVGYGNGMIIIVRVGAALKALFVATTVLILVAIGFKRIPLVMNIIHLEAKMLVQALAFGIAFFACWMGISMLHLMDTPNVIASAYRAGAMVSVLVAVIAFLHLYRFKKRHNRLLSSFKDVYILAEEEVTRIIHFFHF